MAKKLAKYVAQQKEYQRTKQAKELRNKATKRYARTEKGKQANWRLHLRRHYGITIEEYNHMFEKQKGCCAICGKHQLENTKGQALGVDHNHKTGQVRGLLCSPCNQAIGQLKVDELGVALFLKAIDYINRAKEATDG